MLVVSKESIARVRGYQSPWMAAAIISMILYFVGTGICNRSVKELEDDFAKPFELSRGANNFVSDIDGVYLLVKVIDRYGCARSPKHSGVRNSPGFSFKVLDSDASSLSHWYWFKDPILEPNSIDDCTIHAACYLRKGQKVCYDMRYIPGSNNERFGVRVYRLGARLCEMLPQPQVRASRHLVAGRILSPGDYVVASEYKFAAQSSKLDLPVPLIDEPVNLKLKQGLLLGEEIKSSMLELPKSEEELRKFLAARSIVVTAMGPNLR